ncbi:MAG TPA: hypothetical protein PLT09_05890 [Deltaproteobacteria bacterium]|nr:hypothetical protein [Deltaproteobacteria bacterium]HPR56504.1 hypothetical protein [Deltaproteobacteria bacterium]HXK46950.1 hypothetical protein [Deltaproteobacteria bacterium]
MRRGYIFSQTTSSSILVILLLVLIGCSSGGGGSSQEPEYPSVDIPALYSAVDIVTVHTGYEPGAEPFAGYTQDAFHFPYWSVTETNLQALFQGRVIEPDIVVPYELSDMETIPEADREAWTVSQIMDTADELWDMTEVPGTTDFYVVFLKGYFQDGDEVKEDILGVSITGSPIIAIFKDVFASSPYFSSFDKAIIEQSTLVHELAHGMGLVNLGVPMVVDHEDPDHQHHCVNEACDMYWQSDWRSLVVFAQQIIDTGSTIMFCDECLADTRSYTP